MLKSKTLLHYGVLLVLTLACRIVQGQQPKTSPGPAPCSVTPEPDPCGTTPAPTGGKSATEKFPFPGASEASTPAAPAPSLTGVPDSPAKSSPSDATRQFPFPGDATPANPSTGAATSSSSSSSSSDASQFDPAAADTAPAATDKGSEGTPQTPGRHILHRVNPVGTKLQSADERESEDLSVARFYMDSGNLSGALLRGQDAVKTVPDDPEAHLVLAEAAQKLNKLDLAQAEYSACLKLDPPEKQAKEARKELAKLKP